MRRTLILLIFTNLALVVLVAAMDAYATRAAPLTEVGWPTLTLTPISSGLSEPVSITHAGDGSNRIFVVEQTGQIRIIKGNSLVSTPFLNLGSTGANRIIVGSEQGLLGLAFPPGYSTKKYFYVYYTNPNFDLVIARYFTTSNPDVADPNSEQIVLSIPHPVNTNHNGGQLQFGPDGYLYIGPGDGGSGGDPNNNAQNLGVLLGKILRINVEPLAVSGVPVVGPFKLFLPLIFSSGPTPPLTYTIPTSNPFTQTVGARGEIWALGVRNPWRFSFDRTNGNLYIGDVGQGAWEEVDFQPAASTGGENYGWRILEGNHCYPPSQPTCTPPSNYVPPVAEYSHSLGCSVTGGYVYRGPSNAAMQGIYFYGDYCSGRIWGLQKDGNTWVTQQITQTAYTLSTFGENQAGNLFVTDYFAGTIYQITSP
ncbi:MAG: PQQ-dependent sugar dehydrogenase [Chloroflexi bacterium]|nr:PQQ-dependent sugar dehydrogenase [Chloroflexota bacterium]